MPVSARHMVATSGLAIGNSEHASEPAHQEHREHETTRSTTPPDRATRSRYMTSTTLTPSPRAPLTAFPVSYSLLILIPDPSCLPPPRLRPYRYLPGLPCHFYWQVEEGGSSAKRWTPLPRKSRRDAVS